MISLLLTTWCCTVGLQRWDLDSLATSMSVAGNGSIGRGLIGLTPSLIASDKFGSMKVGSVHGKGKTTDDYKA